MEADPATPTHTHTHLQVDWIVSICPKRFQVCAHAHVLGKCKCTCSLRYGMPALHCVCTIWCAFCTDRLLLHRVITVCYRVRLAGLLSGCCQPVLPSYSFLQTTSPRAVLAVVAPGGTTPPTGWASCWEWAWVCPCTTGSLARPTAIRWVGGCRCHAGLLAPFTQHLVMVAAAATRCGMWVDCTVRARSSQQRLQTGPRCGASESTSTVRAAFFPSCFAGPGALGLCPQARCCCSL